MENKRIVHLKNVCVLTLTLLISAASFAQNSANFSGSWALNESKSNMGEGGSRRVSQKLTISQDEKILKLERSFTGQDGTERTVSETYTLDGKLSVNPVFNTSKKSTATWSADKKSLTVTSVMIFEMNGEKNEIKSVEVYKLNDEGNALSIDSQSTSQMGERKSSLVYNKK
jgi:hypothetical protein